jgi:hypothetical protein
LRITSKVTKAFVLAFAFAASAAAICADAAPAVAAFIAKGFPDNGDLRAKIFSYVIGASRDVAIAYGEKRLSSASAGQVTVRVENRSSDFIVEFINQGASGGDSPGRGSTFIQRSNAKGNYILQARILLEDDPSCYLALTPSGTGTRGDVVMYGAVLKRGLYFSEMIYRLLLLSFSDIVDATGKNFDWGLVFNFGGKDATSAYVADLRSSLAEAPGLGEQSAPSAATVALGTTAVGKFSLAAAPALPSAAPMDAAAKGPRAARIAAALDRASSPEAFLLEIAASGESGSREVTQVDAAAFIDDAAGINKIVYGDYPRLDRGIPAPALRSALYLDLLANPESAYAVMSDGVKAIIVPAFDEAGRLGFAVFSGGKEIGMDDFLAGHRDQKLRVVRIQA